jgi:hypothetical protein
MTQEVPILRINYKWIQFDSIILISYDYFSLAESGLKSAFFLSVSPLCKGICSFFHIFYKKKLFYVAFVKNNIIFRQLENRWRFITEIAWENGLC